MKPTKRMGVALGTLSLWMALCGSPGTGASTVVAVARFEAVELRGGGRVTVRHGSAQRVTLRQGDARHTRIEVEEGQLRVWNCVPDCPRGYRLELEVETPKLTALAVSDGGTIHGLGEFPPATELAVAVEQGGVLDARSLAADSVAAAVHSGGLILTHPRQQLTANVSQGGNITYWGDPQVNSAIQHGGVVEKGKASDAERPLAELSPPYHQPMAPVPPVPPVPPLPPSPPGI